MDAQQQHPYSQMEVPDSDEVPLEYRNERVASGRGRPPNNRARNDPRRNSSSVQSTQTSRGVTRKAGSQRARDSTPVKESPSIFQRVTSQVTSQVSSLLSSTPKRSSPKYNSQEPSHERQENTETSFEKAQRNDDGSEQIARLQQDIIDLKRTFQNTLESKEREWRGRVAQCEHHISQINHRLGEETRIFQAKLHESESEKSNIQEQYNAFVRKHQEVSFKQMESARWIPMDEGKVMGDLDRLKRDMRTWAKTTAIQSLSLLQSLSEEEIAALMRSLANVVLLENDQLPKELHTAARSPILLLNALLAHSVYRSFFQSPFFFLGHSDEDTATNNSPRNTLEDIYRRAQEANEQDAHTWRSQTLRLLLPPLRNDSSDAEKQLRRTTEDTIARVADWHASNFLTSPASYLINKESEPNFIVKLKKIYTEGARVSYMLWTRRTAMRCFTLQDIKHLTFDAESLYFDPDSLVKYEDHEGHLKDKPVTVIVHPLLKVYGTDEAKDYEHDRVWAKGVVWLDSRAG